MQSRHLKERLRNQNKTVQIKGNHGTDHVDPAPRTLQAASVAREDGNREHHQR